MSTSAPQPHRPTHTTPTHIPHTPQSIPGEEKRTSPTTPPPLTHTPSTTQPSTITTIAHTTTIATPILAGFTMAADAELAKIKPSWFMRTFFKKTLSPSEKKAIFIKKHLKTITKLYKDVLKRQQKLSKILNPWTNLQTRKQLNIKPFKHMDALEPLNLQIYVSNELAQINNTLKAVTHRLHTLEHFVAITPTVMSTVPTEVNVDKEVQNLIQKHQKQLNAPTKTSIEQEGIFQLGFMPSVTRALSAEGTGTRFGIIPPPSEIRTDDSKEEDPLLKEHRKFVDDLGSSGVDKKQLLRLSVEGWRNLISRLGYQAFTLENDPAITSKAQRDLVALVEYIREKEPRLLKKIEEGHPLIKWRIEQALHELPIRNVVSSTEVREPGKAPEEETETKPLESSWERDKWLIESLIAESSSKSLEQAEDILSNYSEKDGSTQIQKIRKDLSEAKIEMHRRFSATKEELEERFAKLDPIPSATALEQLAKLIATLPKMQQTPFMTRLRKLRERTRAFEKDFNVIVVFLRDWGRASEDERAMTMDFLNQIVADPLLRDRLKGDTILRSLLQEVMPEFSEIIRTKEIDSRNEAIAQYKGFLVKMASVRNILRGHDTEHPLNAKEQDNANKAMAELLSAMEAIPEPYRTQFQLAREVNIIKKALNRASIEPKTKKPEPFFSQHFLEAMRKRNYAGEDPDKRDVVQFIKNGTRKLEYDWSQSDVDIEQTRKLCRLIEESFEKIDIPKKLKKQLEEEYRKSYAFVEPFLQCKENLIRELIKKHVEQSLRQAEELIAHRSDDKTTRDLRALLHFVKINNQGEIFDALDRFEELFARVFKAGVPSKKDKEEIERLKDSKLWRIPEADVRRLRIVERVQILQDKLDKHAA